MPRPGWKGCGPIRPEWKEAAEGLGLELEPEPGAKETHWDEVSLLPICLLITVREASAGNHLVSKWITALQQFYNERNGGSLRAAYLLCCLREEAAGRNINRASAESTILRHKNIVALCMCTWVGVVVCAYVLCVCVCVVGSTDIWQIPAPRPLRCPAAALQR